MHRAMIEEKMREAISEKLSRYRGTLLTEPRKREILAAVRSVIEGFEREYGVLVPKCPEMVAVQHRSDRARLVVMTREDWNARVERGEAGEWIGPDER